jgi:hypothetical protein
VEGGLEGVCLSVVPTLHLPELETLTEASSATALESGTDLSSSRSAEESQCHYYQCHAKLYDAPFKARFSSSHFSNASNHKFTFSLFKSTSYIFFSKFIIFFVSS